MAEKRIAVVGTGANGGAIAANMTDAGFDVTCIEQWPAHVEAIRERGLVVRTPQGDRSAVAATALDFLASPRRHDRKLCTGEIRIGDVRNFPARA